MTDNDSTDDSDFDNLTVSGSAESVGDGDKYVSVSKEIEVGRRVFGTFELPSGGRAREVFVTYEDGTSRREIEVAVNERYQRQFVEVDDE